MRNFLRISLATVLLLSLAGSLAAKDTIRIAVVPFSVRSADDIGYVIHGITDILSSRLSADGSVEVLENEVVQSTLAALKKDNVAVSKPGKGVKKTAKSSVSPKEGAELTREDLVKIGRNLGADFVVGGSITKIGNYLNLSGNLIDVKQGKSVLSLSYQCPSIDEVIPKTNELAVRVITFFGPDPLIQAAVQAPPVVPIVATADAPKPPSPAPQPPVELKATPPTAVPAPESYRNPEFVLPNDQTKTANTTGDFIRTPEPLNRKGFWMSSKFKTDFKGMDVGDVDGDNANEVIVIDGHNVMVYRMKGNDLALVQKIAGKSYDNYLAVDVADINGNGAKEIFVTSIARNLLDSFVLEYRNGKFERIASDLRWFLRVINNNSGTHLLGQMLGIGDAFSTSISEMGWNGKEYVEKDKLPIPRNFSIYGLTIDKLRDGDTEKLITFDNFDYLCLYDYGVNPEPESKFALFKRDKGYIWKSEEILGGSNNSFENVEKRLSENTDDKNTYVNLRILTRARNNSSDKEVVVVHNISPAGRLFKNIRIFTSSEVRDLEWNGLDMVENWRTKPLKGAVADYQMKDIDNDGKDELVLALSLTVGLSFSEQSVIVAYKLDN
ncbi:MAG: FG-GAP-like repeat-containing protein [Smithellaceae bacterium]|nr:FG-GAP-like repeat-containing protein [Smithellaceae bacterium]